MKKLVALTLLLVLLMVGVADARARTVRRRTTVISGPPPLTLPADIVVRYAAGGTPMIIGAPWPKDVWVSGDYEQVVISLPVDAPPLRGIVVTGAVLERYTERQVVLSATDRYSPMVVHLQ